MSGDQYVVSLRKSRKGYPTPWLDKYRERFKVATNEAALELKDTNLRGVARVVAFNSLVSQKLKEAG